MRGSKVAIFSENSADWAAIDWAVLSLGAVTVPIYPTVSQETVEYILRDSGASVVFAGEEKLGTKVESAIGRAGLQVLPIYIEGKAPMTLERIVAEGAGDFSEDEWRSGAVALSDEDLATIIYTSGTTGEPKGAMLPHRAFIHQVTAIAKNLPVNQEDRFFSFLPLSHVYERMAGHFLPISVGAEIAYAESLKTLAHDIIIAKPTIIPAVPRFLESVRNKILASVESATGLKKKLFYMALSRGEARLRSGFRPTGFLGGVLDKLVGEKIRERFGGRLRFLVSGGAALSKEIAAFYAAFGINVVQGYGLTETAPVISINHPERNKPDSVGEVLEGVEVQIAEDGEILARGPNLMAGYFNKPDETAQSIDEHGWFHTGDIGRMEGRRLWIADRKKDIIVLSNGKNVAPAHIEGRLKFSRYIEEAMAFGDGSDHIAAIIVPAFEALRHFCHGQGLDTSHSKEMINFPQVAQLLRTEVDKANESLADFERVKGFHVADAPWTQETGELTPSMKVKRPVIKERFADEIARLSR